MFLFSTFCVHYYKYWLNQSTNRTLIKLKIDWPNILYTSVAIHTHFQSWIIPLINIRQLKVVTQRCIWPLSIKSFFVWNWYKCDLRIFYFTDELHVFHIGKRNPPFQHWEPIYIGTHDDPLYDERLSWEGRSDKMTQVFFGFHIVQYVIYIWMYLAVTLLMEYTYMHYKISRVINFAFWTTILWFWTMPFLSIVQDSKPPNQIKNILINQKWLLKTTLLKR